MTQLILFFVLAALVRIVSRAAVQELLEDEKGVTARTTMKRTGKIITGCFLVFSFTMQAGWPLSPSFASKDKVSSVALKQSTHKTFVSFRKKQAVEKPSFSFAPVNQLRADFITGQSKKEETSVERVLHWDFKMKFRLNSNMNIIFSYN